MSRNTHLNLAVRTRKAFTLLELVVALVVLGILAAIAVPTFLTVVGNSKNGVAQTDAMSIARNAISLAGTNGQAVSASDLDTAASESANNVTATVTSDLSTDPGVGGVAKLQLVNNEFGTVTVCINFPSQVNGSPTFVGYSC